mmetsp:Transcript_80995/g.247490  ORF Transcript_80995/g.247490 Transcript_80995/m.247490 type:complete len:274 (+) Transcript_80995:202-1023(+)
MPPTEAARGPPVWARPHIAIPALRVRAAGVSAPLQSAVTARALPLQQQRARLLRRRGGARGRVRRRIVGLRDLDPRLQRLQGARAPPFPLEVGVLDLAALRLQLGTQAPQQPEQEDVIRPVLVAQPRAIIGELLECLGLPCAKHALRRALLHVPDLDKLVGLRLGLQPGPRQGAAEEVQPRVARGLQVVPSALREVALRTSRSVPHRPFELVLLSHRHVRTLLPIPLRQAEVYEVQVVPLCRDPAHEVVGLDVAVHDAARMQKLDASQHLLRS